MFRKNILCYCNVPRSFKRLKECKHFMELMVRYSLTPMFFQINPIFRLCIGVESTNSYLIFFIVILYSIFFIDS